MFRIIEKFSIKLNSSYMPALFGKCVVSAGLLALLCASQVGASSASFLEIPVGARAAALGGAFSAFSGDPDSLAYNPGALAFSEDTSASLMHSRYADGMAHDWAAAARPGKHGVSAVGIDALATGSIDSYDVSDNPLDSVSASDLALIFSHSRLFNLNFLFLKKAGLGVSLKYITERLDTERANAGAVDLGLLAETSVDGLRFSFAAQDFGTRMKFVDESASLPSRLRTGLLYETSLFNMNWAYSAELLMPTRGRGSFLAGVEASPYKRLFLRAGWQNARDMGTHLTCGMGFLLPLSSGTDMRLDYALADYGEFGGVHRFSLNFKFKGAGQ